MSFDRTLDESALFRICFVCTGNICRSPMAEVITRTLAESTELGDGSLLADHLEVRSAGTGPWHEGEPMHPFATSALERGGIEEIPARVLREQLPAGAGAPPPLPRHR